MSLKARVGDQASGICVHGGSPFSWSGTVTGGSSDVLVNGLGDARLGDAVITNCPSCPSCQLVQGSATVLVNGLGTSRLGASVVGPSAATGNITSSSLDVLAGG